ncbi:MAG: RlpA-like double-psi beta-barrel domain-containing protein [Chloroflexota bacterium]|nr:RlpA-like double-psi beta-barrel domain-containing protein [Chloroflexota bacterium]
MRPDLQPKLLGVAHPALPCGTLTVLSYDGRSITLPVIDRGPYVAGRVIDLSNATKLALGCTDLCTLRMQIAR